MINGLIFNFSKVFLCITNVFEKLILIYPKSKIFCYNEDLMGYFKFDIFNEYCMVNLI
jgi:hypothetical protein